MKALELLDQARELASQRVASLSSSADLDAAETELLGKDSLVGQVRRSMGALDASERPIVGAALQETTGFVTELLHTRRADVVEAEERSRLAEEVIDVTLERLTLPSGVLHVVQQTIDEMVDIFVGLGYQVAAGPEAELAWYNFDALNTPSDHPARWEQDTMYLQWGDPADEVLLRTHTSPVQARWMEEHDPPVYIVVPGRAYRRDTIDATHLPVFHQMEGLAVDDRVTFGDLKGTLLHFAKEFFGPATRVRLRPHFFPFTEPSAELDASCFNCDGGEAGCRVCGGAGWIELGGCGMVDPNVFEAVGYDPSSVQGFAFGVGPERIAMVRHGIESLRPFIDNDLRFLRQFS